MAAVYRRFEEMVGASCWERPVKQSKAAIRHNKLLAEYLVREHETAFSLAHVGELLRRYGGLGPGIELDEAHYGAMSLAAQVLSLADILPNGVFQQFRKRVAEAFTNPDAMRALRFELSVATHFARRGLQLHWPEATDSGIYDLLVTMPDGSELEVECKSISTGKGRSIHRREALDFFHLVLDETKSIRDGLRVGLSVVITVPTRLPTQHAQ